MTIAAATTVPPSAGLRPQRRDVDALHRLAPFAERVGGGVDRPTSPVVGQRRRHELGFLGPSQRPLGQQAFASAGTT